MEEIFAFFNQGWVGIVIGTFIAIVVSAYYYRKNRIGPRLVYQTKAYKIIGKDERAIPDDVKIFFKEQQIERLVKNYVIIWNSGYSTFEGKNIIERNPFRAVFNDRILQVTQLKTTRLENMFQAKISSNQNEVIFYIDYLEPEDGAVFEIYHMGDELFPSMKGSIKGLPQGVINWGEITTFREERRFKIPKSPILVMILGLGAGMMLIVVGLAIILTIYLSISMGISELITGNWSSIILFIVPIFPLYFVYRMIVDYLAERKRFPKALRIKELEL
jgi:hypothetical protein